MSTDYDKDLINRDVVAICDHYLTSKRGEGKRQTYLCPACGDRNFEVDPQLGYAGCFDAACEVPKSTDALGIIAYFEGKELSGEGFVMCLKKGYEILTIPDPEEEDEQLRRSANGARLKAMTPRREKTGQPQKAMTPRADRRSNNEEVPSNGASSVYSSSPQWGAATSVPSDTSGTALTEQPIQAWQENADGTHSAVAAVVIREPDPETESEDAEELEEAELAEESQRQTDRTDDRQTAHEVFEELLRLCRREERDEAFLKDRGLDQAAIEEGRFGSISKSRCNYVISRLRKKFSDEALLSVPGFRKTESGQMRFSLYGDYVLMPYYDGEGYIRTVEGRFTGEEMGEYDKKYKALLNSAVHLYVHPRHKPGEVVAICEGAIGAMVAARYGFAVASIKGMRNYRCRADGGLYSVLPELAGVDFAGKVVVYIPDLDVKPQTREEAFSLVPEACQWMIERQGGVAKVAMLPEGAKDLDAWILSLDEEEREQKIGELLSGALQLEQWKQQYLDTDESDVCGDDQVDQHTMEQAEFTESDSSSTNESQIDSSSTDEPQDDSQTAHSSNRRRVFGGSGSQDGQQGPSEASEPDGGQQQPLEGFTETVSAAEDSQTAQDAGEQGESQPTPSRRKYSKGSKEAKPTDNTGSKESKKQEGREGGEGTAAEEESRAAGGEGDSGATDEEDQRTSEGGQDEDDTTELEPVSDGTEYELPTPAFEVSTKGEWALTTLAYVTATVLLSVLINVMSTRYLGWLGPPPLWWGAGLAAFIAIWVTAGFRKLRKSQKSKSLRRHIEGPDV